LFERVVGAGRKKNHGLGRPEGLNSPPGGQFKAAVSCMQPGADLGMFHGTGPHRKGAPTATSSEKMHAMNA